MSSLDDYNALIKELDAAEAAGDTAHAKIIAQHAMDAWAFAQEEQKLPAEGPMKSLGLGVAREGQRMVSGAQDIGQRVKRSYKGELGTTPFVDIAAREKVDQREFEERTRKHPGLATVGGIMPYLPFAGGSTPLRAFSRGVIPGLLSYTEEDSDRAIQAVLGGGANLAGSKALRNPLLNTQGARANRLGMAAQTEARGPTLFPKTMANTQAYARSAYGVTEANKNSITNEVTKTLGVKGNKFTHDTFNDIESRASKLFNDAVSSRENLYLSGFSRRLDSAIDKQYKKIADDPGTRKILTRLRQRLDDNGDIISAKEYQQFRSDLTTKAGTFKKKPAKARAIRQVVKDLDNAAEATIGLSDPKALQSFKEARRLWRQLNIYKKPGVIQDDGRVNPSKLRSVLKVEDESGYLMNKNKSDLYEMLRLDQDLPVGQKGVDAFGRRIDFKVTPQSMGQTGARVIETPLLGASRLPTRAMEGAPLGLMMQNNPTLDLKSLLEYQEENE